MANKRMFSKQITNSDAFTDMPVSSQLLYFHLNMEADDDGFVSNPKRIMRMLNVGDDDIKILLAKRFLLSFESGVVVIKHWLLHNAVRKDMYQETQYLDEKKRLKVKDNKAYTEVRNESVTVPLHRLDQVRLDQVRIDKIAETSSAPFSLEEKLKDMEKIENSYLDIIATFIREKPVKVENSRQLSAVISRYCRVAKKLAGAYSNKQIFDTAEKIKNGDLKIDWTLETLWKQLTK